MGGGRGEHRVLPFYSQTKRGTTTTGQRNTSLRTRRVRNAESRGKIIQVGYTGGGYESNKRGRQPSYGKDAFIHWPGLFGAPRCGREYKVGFTGYRHQSTNYYKAQPLLETFLHCPGLVALDASGKRVGRDRIIISCPINCDHKKERVCVWGGGGVIQGTRSSNICIPHTILRHQFHIQDSHVLYYYSYY